MKELKTEAELWEEASNKSEERILCSAIWFDDGNEYVHQPVNINSGLVVCGLRHCNCFATIGGLVKERQELGIYEKEQGFLTSKNRFVDREEGMQIAIKNNQLIKPSSDKRLFSEDLY